MGDYRCSVPVLWSTFMTKLIKSTTDNRIRSFIGSIVKMSIHVSTVTVLSDGTEAEAQDTHKLLCEIHHSLKRLQTTDLKSPKFREISY